MLNSKNWHHHVIQSEKTDNKANKIFINLYYSWLTKRDDKSDCRIYKDSLDRFRWSKTSFKLATQKSTMKAVCLLVFVVFTAKNCYITDYWLLNQINDNRSKANSLPIQRIVVQNSWLNFLTSCQLSKITHYKCKSHCDFNSKSAEKLRSNWISLFNTRLVEERFIAGNRRTFGISL